MTEFAGVYAAAITPRGKHGEVDMGAAFELIDCLCAARLGGIVLFGDAGEYPAFTAEERSRLIYLAVKRSRIPVLAGVGSATLDTSVDLAREARDAGAAGLLLPPPLFPRYDPDDLHEFYLEFSRQVGRPAVVFLSNTPAAISDLPAHTALDLLATGLFAGIEEGRGGLESFLRMKAAANGAYQVLAANDAVFTRARCAGAGCAISAVASAAPELMTSLDRAIACVRKEQIERLDRALQEFLDWAGQFPPSVAMKVAAGLRGWKTGALTIPLSPAKQKLLDEFRAWFQAWLPAVKRLCANG